MPEFDATYTTGRGQSRLIRVTATDGAAARRSLRRRGSRRCGLGDGGFQDSGEDFALRAGRQAWQIRPSGQARR